MRFWSSSILSFLAGTVPVGVVACGAGTDPAGANGRAPNADAGPEELGRGSPPESAAGSPGSSGAGGGPPFGSGGSSGETQSPVAAGAPGVALGPDAGPTSSTTVEVPVPTPDDGPCVARDPGRAPLRRLTRFEYSNTVSDLLSDDTRPGAAFPQEVGRFGNDADLQSASAFLVETYLLVSEEVAARAMVPLLQRFPCIESRTTDTEAACAESIIETVAAEAFRRPLTADEVDELVVLQGALRADGTFEQSIESLLSAILQGPDFLYRLEYGATDDECAPLRRPTGWELATRLSYLLWGTQPDAELAAAAASGELESAEGVLAQARRLLGDRRARRVVSHFFDRLLPIQGVPTAGRDPELYPAYTSEIAELMVEETHGFLDHEIFENNGTWQSVLTAPYVFINDALGAYYGISGATDSSFVRVDVDPAITHRMGLLTQGGILTGTTLANATSPVRRGNFVAKDLLCQSLEPPANLEPAPPSADPVLGPTTRDRFEATTLADAECASCHTLIDPMGFALENYDAVGQWRDEENGTQIDAAAETLTLGSFNGPLELIQAIAESPATYDCFSQTLAEFGYGRKLGTGDEVVLQRLQDGFAEVDYDVQAFLLSLTQTDAFLYLPPAEATP